MLASVAAAAGALDCTSSGFVFAGPVCVIGTTRSVFTGAGGLRGAVIVNTPSDDNDDWTSFKLEPAGNWYFRTNCREMKLSNEGNAKSVGEIRHPLLTRKKYFYLPMFIGFLLMFALNNNVFVGGLDGDFVWCELLHIQNHLEFIVFHIQCGSGFFTSQIICSPWTNVATAWYWWPWIPERWQEIVTTQCCAEFLIEQSWWTEWTIEIIPPVPERQWYDRHVYEERMKNMKLKIQIHNLHKRKITNCVLTLEFLFSNWNFSQRIANVYWIRFSIPHSIYTQPKRHSVFRVIIAQRGLRRWWSCV